jgi:hypothetical protein
VLEARRARPPFVGRDALDGLVEADVRFLPIENANEVIAESTCGFGHGRSLADFRLQTTDYRLQTTDYRLQTTDYRLQEVIALQGLKSEV